MKSQTRSGGSHHLVMSSQADSLPEHKFDNVRDIPSKQEGDPVVFRARVHHIRPLGAYLEYSILAFPNSHMQVPRLSSSFYAISSQLYKVS